MATPKNTKAEKTPLLTTRKATTPAPAVTRAVMLVTPALAAEWLKSNTRNRALDQRAVEALSKAILAGQWRVTHQGVAFGADGTLYDGQHRLHAIVAAGTAVHMEVTRGLAPEDLDAIDNGGKGGRRAHEVLHITDGVRLGRNQAGVLSAADQMIDGKPLVGITRLTPERLRSALSNHGAALAAVNDIVHGAHTTGISCAPVVAALMIVWRTEPVRALEFAAMLRTGENLTAHHPALALRNLLLARSTRSVGGGLVREELTLRTFAAVDAYIRGASLRTLKANVGARDRYVAAWKRAAEG